MLCSIGYMGVGGPDGWAVVLVGPSLCLCVRVWWDVSCCIQVSIRACSNSCCVLGQQDKQQWPLPDAAAPTHCAQQLQPTLVLCAQHLRLSIVICAQCGTQALAELAQAGSLQRGSSQQGVPSQEENGGVVQGPHLLQQQQQQDGPLSLSGGPLRQQRHRKPLRCNSFLLRGGGPEAGVVADQMLRERLGIKVCG